MEQPLRIAILSLHSCPYTVPGGRYTGGMNIYIRNLSMELGRLGHAVDIYTCSHPGDAQCGNGDFGENTRLIHIDTTDYSLVSEANLENNTARITGAILGNAPCYDLIYSHYWFSGLVGARLKSAWQVPHFTMFHTLGLLKNRVGLGELEPAYRIAGETSVMRSADRIIASTAAEKRELVAGYNVSENKITVVPCGINHDLFRPVDKLYAKKAVGLGPGKTVLFVGRNDPLKGLENALEAVSLLNHRDDFQLVVIGDNGPHTNTARPATGTQAAGDAGRRTIFIGSVPHGEMYLYYNAADFCLIPSYYESFSLVAMEAIACGTHVLATSVGEIADLAAMCGACRIIEDNTPSSLAGHIDDMLDSAGISTDNGISNLVMNYSWKSVTGALLHEFSKAAALNRCHERAALRR